MRSLKDITAGFPNTAIAVIGDLCLDMYLFLTDEMSEVSVETGLRTRSVSGFKHEAGGAGNIAINLKTLGASTVDLYGVCGNDPFGRTLKTILSDAGVDCSHIQTQESEWNTHVYQKTYMNNQEEPRNDIGNFNRVQDSIADALLDDLEANLHKYHAVLINEQIIHGYQNTAFQTDLAGLIERHENDCLWITDCRHLNDVYNRTIRKLNIYEALELYETAHPESGTVPGHTELATWLHNHWRKPVVVTLGPEGAVAVDGNGEIHTVPGINLIGPLDTVGAGDAFLSGLALTLASGAALEEALNIGNFSANVSVTKLFETGHPTLDEILDMGASPDYRFNPELAFDTRRAVYLPGTDIELISLDNAPRPRVAIFDHDGTISTLRQGWEPIMGEVAVSAILGETLAGVSSTGLAEVRKAVDRMIEETTGIQTIAQMHYLRDMVRSQGAVPEDEILSPQGYKKIYNDKLLLMVKRRVELFRSGFLNLEDVTIKGSARFLKRLRDAGTILYLASGTDQDDVRSEAAVLGYSEYFDGGIYGSVGNHQRDPKRIVLENIISSLPDGVKPDECYVFGDGPVEMREAARNGFTRIGLVSDEKQRFGTNPEKRPRLILGGAEALIPDFSWIDPLIEYLGWDI